MPAVSKNASKSILVIDDEEEGADLLAKRLRACGYQVACVSKGLEAVAAVREGRPDLVLLDVWLPDLSGPDIFKELRKDTELKRIPVIFLSADPSQESLCVRVLGAEAFFRKPYDGQSLMRAISDCLASAEGGPASGP